MTLSEISRWCEGELKRGNGSTVIRRVVTDTRTLGEGDFFVALRGERFDGHDFLVSVEAKRAAGAMVMKNAPIDFLNKLPVILVDNTLTGFQRLAANYRRQFSIRMVAVAGSNGKTGTKEMIATVLGEKWKVLKTEGNLNNHIGVPMSLLRLEPEHEVAVLEVGTNHPGELSPILEWIQPDTGVLTAIGEEHLEFFKDLDGVAREEGTLAEVISSEGTLILNADDVWTPAIRKRTAARIQTFGFHDSSDFQGEILERNIQGTHFKLKTSQGEIDVRLQLLGRHQVANALAAAAVGSVFGLELRQIRDGLERVRPFKMRMQPQELPGGIRVLNDAYNANPDSMRAALATFGELKGEGQQIAVLGEMKELGDASEEAHRHLGKFAMASGLDVLVVVGDGARPMIPSGHSQDTASVRIEFCETAEAAGKMVRQIARPGDQILLKASRGVALEKTLEAWN